MHFYSIGSINLDYSYLVDEIPKEGETVQCHEMGVMFGGKGLNQAVALSNSGGQTKLIGLVGEEDLLSVTSFLVNHNIDPDGVKFVQENTGHANIYVSKDGDNMITVYPGANHLFTDDIYLDLMKEINEDDIVVLQNEINNISFLIDNLNKRGIKIVLNPSPIDEELNKVNFNNITYLILNEHEFIALFGSLKIENDQFWEVFFTKYPDLKVVLTLGDKGSMYIDANTRIKQASYPTSVIDSSGAGDTFLGYFVSCVYSGNDIKASLDFASIASSMACESKGTAQAIPRMKEVLKRKGESNNEI